MAYFVCGDHCALDLRVCKNGGCKERGDYAAPREGDVIAIPQALLASSIDTYGVCRCEILAFATQSIQKKKEFLILGEFAFTPP